MLVGRADKNAVRTDETGPTEMNSVGPAATMPSDGYQ